MNSEFYQKLFHLFDGDIPVEPFILATDKGLYIVQDFEVVRPFSDLSEDPFNNFIDLQMGNTTMQKLKYDQFLEKWGIIEPGSYVGKYQFMKKWDSQQLPIKMMIDDPEKKAKIKDMFWARGIYLGSNEYLNIATSHKHLKLLEYFDGDIPNGQFLLILDGGFYVVIDHDIKKKLTTDAKIKEYLQKNIDVNGNINIEMKVKDAQRKSEIIQSFLALGICLSDK